MTFIVEAKSMGFAEAATVDAGVIVCEDDIRALCAPEKCANYGSGWICPPGCGSIGFCRETVARYSTALLVQSLNMNVDFSDPDAFLSLTREHNAKAVKLFELIREKCGDAYLLTTGGCEMCEKCTFPDEPCRFPEKNRGSLSAFGINVSRLCEAAEMEYSFEKGILRMVACILY